MDTCPSCKTEKKHETDCPQCHTGGLSRTQHAIHVEERSAQFWGDWPRAQDAKQRLDNADSRSFWERKAEQAKYDYANNPRLAAKMRDVCLNNAKKAPNE